MVVVLMCLGIVVLCPNRSSMDENLADHASSPAAIAIGSFAIVVAYDEVAEDWKKH
jgi:hypothetical protein